MASPQPRVVLPFMETMRAKVMDQHSIWTVVVSSTMARCTTKHSPGAIKRGIVKANHEECAPFSSIVDLPLGLCFSLFNECVFYNGLFKGNARLNAAYNRTQQHAVSQQVYSFSILKVNSVYCLTICGAGLISRYVIELRMCII